MKKYLLALLACLSVGSANATVIDFEATATSSFGGVYNGNPYIEDGFSITTLDNGIHVFEDGWQNNRGSSNGSNYAGIYAYSTSASFQLTKTDSSYFSLVSIDFAELFNNGEFTYAAKSVNVTGTTSLGGTVNSNITIDLLSDGINGIIDFQTLSFNADWSSLATVSFVALNSAMTYIAFDNITVGEAGAKKVPEPTSLALLGLGLAGFGFSRKKKKA